LGYRIPAQTLTVSAMPINRRWSEDIIPPVHLSSWRRRLAEQAGVVDVHQLREYGHSLYDIEANVDALRWQWVLPRVYATFTGPLPRRARLRAALLYGGDRAVLSHHTAAEEWGLVPIEERPVEITVPYACSALSQPPLVRVHRSRAMAYSSLPTNPPRTKRTDTIVDLAAAQETAKEATYVVVDLVTRARVSVSDMLSCVQNRPPWRFRAAIRRGLELIRSGLMSALEAEYAEDVERAHGLPTGRRQTPFVVDGKTLWEDVTYDDSGVPVTESSPASRSTTRVLNPSSSVWMSEVLPMP
jgi:hypothetical protein